MLLRHRMGLLECLCRVRSGTDDPWGFLPAQDSPWSNDLLPTALTSVLWGPGV